MHELECVSYSWPCVAVELDEPGSTPACGGRF